MRTKCEQNNQVRFVRGVRKDHLFACLGHVRQRDREELWALYGPNWPQDEVARQWVQQSVDGLTVFLNDTPIACVVAWAHGPGHWSCGMVATVQWPKVANTTSRYLRRYLRPVLLGQRVRRLSCVVDARYGVAKRWLRFLGFEPEGCLRQYGADGRDFEMFSCLPSTMILRREKHV